MNARPLRSRLFATLAISFAAALTPGSLGSADAAEPFRGWAPLKTRPLLPKYAMPPSTATYPQPLVTIPPNPTPYPYGFFGAVGPHSNVQAGPGSSPGTRAWSYSFRR
ncbi:MAG TPA: hypothetical protein VGN57_05795 [Pirellulaceae bacterium]|jgi:hypothetical protein|nr:hypothetical protein [Pirellulaceae bacterium]